MLVGPIAARRTEAACLDATGVYTGPRRLVFVDLSEGKLRPKLVEVVSTSTASTR